MKRLEGVIKEYYKHVTHPNRSIKFTVDKINDQIRDLLSELGDFPRIHSTEQRRHDYITLQKDIRHKFELLLEKLEQLEELEQMGDES